MGHSVGIMQGRLSPFVGPLIRSFPWGHWEKEFLHAKDIGLQFIDWIVEVDRFNENPLMTKEGTKSIESLISSTGVGIISVCGNYFIDAPLLRCSSSELRTRQNDLERLIDRLNYFGIKILELPFLDNSTIRNKAEWEQIIQIMKPFLDKAHSLGVTLAFETTFAAQEFKPFLSALNHPAACVVYDMGNSASFGFKPSEELEAYGDKVATVHIKDRILAGGSVPLGQGNADLAACFSLLKARNFSGPYIFESARGEGDPIEWTKNNLKLVKKFLESS